MTNMTNMHQPWEKSSLKITSSPLLIKEIEILLEWDLVKFKSINETGRSPTLHHICTEKPH